MGVIGPDATVDRGGAVGFVETSWFIPAGAPANVVTPTWHGTIDAEIEVIGALGTGRIWLLDGPLSLWNPAYTAMPETGLWPEAGGAIAGALREEVSHFIGRVRDGAPESIASIADAILAWQPDVVALSEFRGSPPSTALLENLRDTGLASTVSAALSRAAINVRANASTVRAIITTPVRRNNSNAPLRSHRNPDTCAASALRSVPGLPRAVRMSVRHWGSWRCSSAAAVSPSSPGRSMSSTATSGW